MRTDEHSGLSEVLSFSRSYREEGGDSLRAVYTGQVEVGSRTMHHVVEMSSQSFTVYMNVLNLLYYRYLLDLRETKIENQFRL